MDESLGPAAVDIIILTSLNISRHSFIILFLFTLLHVKFK
jgi:hypothetical protein